jgi:hypothetical protein
MANQRLDRSFQTGLKAEGRSGRRFLSFLILLVTLNLVPFQLSADQPSLSAGEVEVLPEAGSEPPVLPGIDIGLDQLLQLPESGSYGAGTRHGSTPQTWRRRFADSKQAQANAQLRIDRAREAMDKMSLGGSTQWQMAPPGSSASTDVQPMSIQQREEVRAGKEDLVQADRAYRALIIEADLAGVPASWRVPVAATE